MSTKLWTLEKGLCRCCHAEGKFKNLAEPCFDSGQEEIYADMIKDCFLINIVPVPGVLCTMTYTICEACITRLRDAAKFRKNVAACEEKFKDYYNRNIIKAEDPPIEVKVKVEEPDPCQDDDYSLPDDNNHNFEDLPHYGFDDDDSKAELEVSLKKKQKKEHIKSKSASKSKSKSSSKGKKLGRPKKMKEEPIGEEEPMAEEEEMEKRKDYPQVDDYVAEKETSDKKFVCRACEIAYRRISDLRCHINRKHLKEKFIKCQLCPESFMYHSHRKQHMEKAHSLKKPQKFLCENCNRQFKRKNTLAEHMMDIHIEKKCTHCHLKFARKKYLFHMNETHGVPMPTCGVCGLRTLLQSALIRHQRNVHLNEKIKACRVCKKTFYSKSNLRDHMITHDQNRVFKCDVCLKDFARKECYKAHCRIHSGEKPFKCDLCAASFTQRASLRFHIKSHHSEIKMAAIKSGV